MAIKHWTNGAADNLWATAGNWNGGVPGASDTAIIGSQSVANINGATVTGPAKVDITDEYTGAIGSQGSNLIFNTNGPTEVNINGTGTTWISTSGVTISRCRVKSKNKGAQAVNLAGTITDIIGLMGKINALATLTVTTLRIEYALNAMADVIMDIASGATVTNIKARGGTLTSAAGCTEAWFTGGTQTFTQGNIVKLLMQAATLLFNSSAGSIGSAGYLEIGPRGRLDLSRSGVARTIVNPVVAANGLIDMSGVANAITVTGTPVLLGQNAEVRGFEGAVLMHK